MGGATMTGQDLKPLLELRESGLVHHGLVKQQEALLAYAQRNDCESIYDLYSHAVGSAVLIPIWDGDRHRYYLMTRLSEVQWIQQEGDEAVVLWDFVNEVVVVIRLHEGRFQSRVLSGTLQCEEASPVTAVA
jgi:hypothetical protein